MAVWLLPVPLFLTFAACVESDGAQSESVQSKTGTGPDDAEEIDADSDADAANADSTVSTHLGAFAQDDWAVGLVEGL